MTELREALVGLADDTKDYWVTTTVPRLNVPSAVQFMREAVMAYQPVIITGMVDEWPATAKWSQEYLTDVLGDRKVNVNLTPDGHGDCVKRVHYKLPGGNPELLTEQEDCFVYPAEHDMTISEFYDTLADRSCGAVPYLSQQNDNLRQCMPELLNDIPQTLGIAEEVFKSDADVSLEAVNLWIGDERSVSSIHKDHFENMYAVVSGEKTFTLLPPTDVAFLGRYVGDYKTLRYAVKSADGTGTADGATGVEYSHCPRVHRPANGSSARLALELRADNCPSERLQWLPLDPDDPELCSKYPLLQHTRPLRCRVRAGEILYIPAMWYHRVSQSCLTVSVNYWYDQRFDFR
jgi:jumonji domain-containing protein 7